MARISRIQGVGLMAALAVLGAGYLALCLAKPAPEPPRADFRLSGPFVHDNLAIFLIHGDDQFAGKTFLTLDEALEQKKFVIHETQSVNQLTMENLSATDVLILSGDILKGGQQDRIAQHDMLVPARSGKIPLPAFCVERTAPRWLRAKQAGDESFGKNPDIVASNSLRLSNRFYMSQGKVWHEVTNLQKSLSFNLNTKAQAKESDSSLALSLKIKELQAAVEKYIAKLQPAVAGKKDVIGYAFALNGKMLTADVFGSNALFMKVWPKLLRANAVEAVAELQKDRKFATPSAAEASSFLKEAENGKAKSQDVLKNIRQRTCENEKSVLFETLDQRGQPYCIRWNVLSKQAQPEIPGKR